jgi:acetyl/propionyl-CoA carboxylase alpha subunit
MLHWPQRPGLRIDAGIREGQKITSDYDSLLAKIVAWGTDREQARRRLVEALRELVLLGTGTNQSFLLQVLESEAFRKGETYTTTLEECAWTEPALPEAVIAAARAWAPSGGDPGSPARAPGPWETLGGLRVGS